MAYDLFEVFASTQVTSEEVLQAELLAERVLSAKFPTLDLREGSGLRDALVRPNATFLAMMRKALLQYDNDRYLSNMDDNTPEALVDSQLGNFFLRRKEGSSSEVVIRVRFGHDLPVDTVTIPTNAFFSVDNVNRFFPVQTYVLSKGDTLLEYTSVSDNYWYADILCSSDGEGEQFNVVAGTEFLYFTLINNYMTRAVALYLVKQSITTETNTDFIARAETAISTRNLINDVSIPANLNEAFNYINAWRVSGKTDYEMVRDYREFTFGGNDYGMYLGGHVDVYLKTSLVEKIVQVETNGDGDVFISTAAGSFDPIVAIFDTDVEVDDTTGAFSKQTIYGQAADTDPGHVISQASAAGVSYEDLNYQPSLGDFYSKHYGYSSRQSLRVFRSGTPLPANKKFNVKVLQWSNLSSVQSYLDDRANRVVCADYLARGFNVVEIIPHLPVVTDVPLSLAEEASLKAQIVTAAQAFLNKLPPASTFIASELLSSVLTSVTGYTFSLDVSLEARLYDSEARSGILASTLPADGVLTPDDVAGLSGHVETGPKKVAKAYIYYCREAFVS